MKKILVTGGTVFVTRTIAEYYVKKGYEVYVMNRNTKEQPKGVILIQADRHHIGRKLRPYSFDVVIDHAYTAEEVDLLLDALGQHKEYILISSSAVYPEDGIQPFTEECKVGENKFWGQYGINKIEAEKLLLNRNPSAYIVRPPYLYGPMNNVYRESFVFDCAVSGRKFYLPNNGSMKLQFLFVEDMCKFFDILLQKKPSNHIFNVGNSKLISTKDWVSMCYEIVGEKLEFVYVNQEVEQRNYFSFYDYEYRLCVDKQNDLMLECKDMKEGLKESYEWYKSNTEKVNRKPFVDYIDKYLVRNRYDDTDC